MFPLTFRSDNLSRSGGLEHRTPEIELPDVDATKVESLTVEGLPQLGPGDRILIKSGVSGVYRRVVRVEPITGGASLVWLDTGYFIRRDRIQVTT
jgi:hypothetical protein